MSSVPHFLMTDPTRYEVRYRINPWMRPEVWDADAVAFVERAGDASQSLASALTSLGAVVDWVPAAPGLPDLVFPANAGVVLDRRVLLARFQRPERRGEEPHFRRAFERLVRDGVLDHIATLPEGCFHEGAGDALWDGARGHFWVGFGQRSDLGAAAHIAAVFGQPAVPLRLVDPRFYHLDTCFCVLEGGVVLYYPPAFAPDALAAIRAHVAPAQLIEASETEASAFCVNAVSLGREVVMAKAPAPLRARLAARGYRLTEIDLAPFILSGGGAFCMTLRLDRASRPVETSHDRHRDARQVA